MLQTIAVLVIVALLIFACIVTCVMFLKAVFSGHNKRKRNIVPVEPTREQQREKILYFKNLAKTITTDYIIIISRLDFCENIANASSSIPKCIIFNYVWRLCLTKDDPIITSAFLQTLGHELGHKNKDFSICHYICREKWNSVPYRPKTRLIHWVTEIHHDFYGAMVSGNTDDEIIKKIIQCKQSIKNILSQNADKPTDTHPDWDFRLHCLLQRRFDLDLIRQIAEKAGCNNEELIQELHNFYGDIFLDHN